MCTLECVGERRNTSLQNFLHIFSFRLFGIGFGSGIEDSMMCGPIMPQGGIQALEAMLYTLDKINEDLHLLPNITIGAHILDDCDRDSYGLEMAVDFIKGMCILTKCPMSSKPLFG